MAGKGGGIVACVDGLNCITEAVGIYGVAIGEAERDSDGSTPAATDPETELRVKLPRFLEGLSAEARAIVRDHVRHTADLVAFVHRAGQLN